MKNVICVPIRGGKVDEITKKVRRAQRAAPDLIELWLDSLNKKKLKNILDKIKVPVICVNKATIEHGDFSGTEQERVDILKEAITLGVDYIDIGIHTDKILIAELTDIIVEFGSMTQLIISYHDFEKTEDLSELKKIVDSAKELGADIVKIATFANSEEDNEVIFEIIKYIEETQLKAIGLCMGKLGEQSRLQSYKHGSIWTYGALDPYSITAVGQLTISELRANLEEDNAIDNQNS